jgi:hypothetical protein
MGQVVKALQAWGFHNESIAKELDYELAHELGLKKEATWTKPVPVEFSTPPCGPGLNWADVKWDEGHVGIQP